MSVKHPPAIASWLLSVLGHREGLDALAGDLWEEYQERRSPAWYWHQVVSSIAVGALRDLRSHGGCVARGVLTGYAFMGLYAIILQIQSPVWGLLLRLPGSWGLYVGTSMAPMTALGWLVCRFHQRHRAAMLLALVASVFLPIYVSFVLLIVSETGSMHPHLMQFFAMLGLTGLGGLFAGGLVAPHPDPDTRSVSAHL